MRWAALCLGLFCSALAGAQPVYTNSDVNAMKARYVPRSAPKLPAHYPAEFDSRSLDKPKYVPWMLPYQEWTEEYREYFQRHSHDPRVELQPTLICMHYTVVDDAQAVWNGFARGCNMSNGNKGTIFGHVSTHLIIDKDGTVYQLLPFNRRCTGAYGVNHRAISIEMIAMTEGDLLSRVQQVWSSFCVVRDLMKRYNIGPQGVIAHYEVAQGVSVVPDYLDYNDPDCPDRYPAKYFRSDPGPTYMSWLRSYLQKFPVQ
ncbi:MAG: N-acetylmuramoyl-L-alanine amidase [Candidatus Eremiobacteraeota bacterium]|nr:N-acetylmuramoyl-L-alanine amidase [Candidatus Eremiobacteraeota bacterium]